MMNNTRRLERQGTQKESPQSNAIPELLEMIQVNMSFSLCASAAMG